MTFDEFEDRAARDWARIPDEFKAGVDALVVRRDALRHAHSAGVYTLGECVTESYPSDFSGPDTTRSELVLYYGSFLRLAADDADFDWEAELWETLTHELKHHIEGLASQDDLEDLDAAVEENFRRIEGLPFDPLFYRDGEDVGDGWFQLDRTLFLECRLPRGDKLEWDWDGATYSIIIPAVDQPEFLFITVGGCIEPPGELVVVSVRPRSVRSRLTGLLMRRPGNVAEAAVHAVRHD